MQQQIALTLSLSPSFKLPADDINSTIVHLSHLLVSKAIYIEWKVMAAAASMDLGKKKEREK